MSLSSRTSYKRARRIAYTILIVGMAIVFGLQLAGAAAKNDPKALADKARARAAETTVQVKPGEFADRARIQALGEEALKRGRAEMEERLRQYRAGKPIIKQTNTGLGATDSTPADSAKPPLSGRVVVALSSSMPETMLRDYMRQLDGIPEGIVILRKFIGGTRTVAPTGMWVEKLRRKQLDCQRCEHRAVEVVVDPLAYKMLNIDKVPAVAFLPQVQDLKHCDAEELKTSRVIYGATSVSAALRRLTAEGVAVPEELIKRFGART